MCQQNSEERIARTVLTAPFHGHFLFQTAPIWLAAGGFLAHLIQSPPES